MHGLYYLAGFLGPMQTTLLLFFYIEPQFLLLAGAGAEAMKLGGHRSPRSKFRF